MAVSMPDSRMIPVNAPAAKSTPAIISAALACASIRSRCSSEIGIVDLQREHDAHHEDGDRLELPGVIAAIMTRVNPRLIQTRPGRRSASCPWSISRRRTSPRPFPEAQPPRFPSAEPPCARKDERQPYDLHGNQRVENGGHGDLQRSGGPDHRPRPRQEIHARGHGSRARQDSLIHAEPLVQRQHHRYGDQKRDRARAVEMDQQAPAAPCRPRCAAGCFRPPPGCGRRSGRASRHRS